eukprot:CAMPEP_0172696160 /NCGR_PEP_ID=MMETSP1074-20121228/27859_1 /TAXON_ID=2916 /ORGANISM="Ceratium fusus, Strain PA161109" /LENGTH=492 /DNA_ID=CAMNT_0013516865 /DNA_START=67 /DNA_END=1541 /DNA_ORIENTATION=+
MAAATAGRSGQPQYTLSQFRADGDLGAGSFGQVRRVVNEETGEVFAMKVMEKEKVVQRGLQEQLRREVLTQLRVRHANVVKLHYYFEDAASIYCLLEYADAGQLFAYLQKHPKGVPEPRAAQLFADSASGLGYLHSLRVAHRDLKPENILLFGQQLRAKLCDFGWCVELTPENPARTTFCGTMEYVAPEMLTSEPHDGSVDIWALGVLLYEMLLARSPFVGASQKETMERIIAVRYELPKGVMTQGPEELIRGLLQMEAHARMSLARVLRHPWVAAARSETGTADADAHADGLDATRAAPRRGAAAGSGHENDSSADLDATRIANRRTSAAAANADSDAACALDGTVIMPRRQAPKVEPLGTSGLDATRVVRRRKPEAIDELDTTDPRMPNLHAMERPCLGTKGDLSTRFAFRGPQGSRDAELLSVAEDERIGMDTLAELDVRFLGAPGSGCSGSSPRSSREHSSIEADFWIIRTEVAASRHPRPKARSRRG